MCWPAGGGGPSNQIIPVDVFVGPGLRGCGGGRFNFTSLVGLSLYAEAMDLFIITLKCNLFYSVPGLRRLGAALYGPGSI